MAEEDLIFGKNRHMFGGIEPSNMKAFTVAMFGNKAMINYTLPSDTIVNGQTLCTVAGAVIRRKTTGFPVDEFDGDLVANVTSSGYVYDEDITSIKTICYYAAFPYTTQGVYNRSPQNRFAFSFDDEHYLYGYDLTLADSNPNTRVSYPSDVFNTDFTPAKMNFTSGVFEYGGWSAISTPGKHFMPKPCLLKYGYSPSVIQYLYPDDYNYQCTYNSDGNPVKGSSSAVGDASSGANAMMEWPKIYTHREVVDGVYKFRCSDTKLGSDWECWCNYDKNNKEIDHFYTGIYLGLYQLDDNHNDRLRSISDKTPYSFSKYSTAFQYATTNGSDWYTDVYCDRLLIQDLLVMMAKSTDTKTAYGHGGHATTKTGTTMNQKGMFWGQSDGLVKVFGMENYWTDDVGRLTAGIITYLNGYAVRIKMTRGTKDGSTISDYTDGTYSIYEDVFEKYNYAFSPSYYQNGFINSTYNSKYGRIPNGADSTSSQLYETDYLDLSSISMPSSTTTARCALTGFAKGRTNSSGLFTLSFGAIDYTASSSYWQCPMCCSLSCKPSA